MTSTFIWRIPTTITVGSLWISFTPLGSNNMSARPRTTLEDYWMLSSHGRDSVVENLLVDPPIHSDHGLISCFLPFLAPSCAVFNTRGIRSWRRLDCLAFREALSSGPLCRDDDYYDAMSTDQLFDLYHSTMSGALDAFLPVRSVTTRFQPSAPWFDDECRAIKRRVRMLERRYRLTRMDVDRLSWIEAARSKHRQFREMENLYWEAWHRIEHWKS